MARGSVRRAIVFRAAAVLLGFAPLLAAEATFALLGWGEPDDTLDPFLGFRAARPLFVLSDDGLRYEIESSRLPFFRPAAFPRKKEPGEFRIFCLGGSTVQGSPFAVETSFTSWLQLGLEAADPTRRWRVVNCGGISYASYRLAPILQEVLRYDPDLVILCTGHNEFLEDRTYGHIKRWPDWLTGPMNTLLNTRTCTLLRGGLRCLCPSPPAPPSGFPVLRAEADAILDYRGGLAAYHHDERWRRDTIAHFRFNLGRMVRLASEAGRPLLLVNPVSNLRHCGPFKSEHRPGLGGPQRDRFQALLEQAERAETAQPMRAVAALREALAVDEQFAGAHFRLASLYDRLGRIEDARRHYVLAKERDVCPLRMLEAMREDLLEIARVTGTPLVDVRDGFERLSDVGIPGSESLLDHVHPAIEGHQRIAGWLLDELVRQGSVTPVDGWREARESAYQEHLASLDDLYFQLGLERLRVLRRWTQGQADGVPGQTPATKGDSGRRPGDAQRIGRPPVSARPGHVAASLRDACDDPARPRASSRRNPEPASPTARAVVPVSPAGTPPTPRGTAPGPSGGCPACRRCRRRSW